MLYTHYTFTKNSACQTLSWHSPLQFLHRARSHKIVPHVTLFTSRLSYIFSLSFRDEKIYVVIENLVEWKISKRLYRITIKNWRERGAGREIEECEKGPAQSERKRTKAVAYRIVPSSLAYRLFPNAMQIAQVRSKKFKRIYNKKKRTHAHE